MFFLDVEWNCRPRFVTAVKIDKVSVLCLEDVYVLVSFCSDLDVPT